MDPKPTSPKRVSAKSSRWLTRRSEFLAAAKKGRRHHAALFTIQGLRRTTRDGPARFGLTLTGKTGDAVERNRMKRRLRAALATFDPALIGSGTDFVLIGRRELLDAPFQTILDELTRGFARLTKELNARPASHRLSSNPTTSAPTSHEN